MSQLADEVTLYHLGAERITTDRPYIEYVTKGMRAEPIHSDQMDISALARMETHKVPIVKWVHVTSYNKTERSIAFTREAQDILDMYIKQTTTQFMETIEEYKRVNKNLQNWIDLERSKTCMGRFINWLEGKFR